jgi:ATP-dependent exoDNAse (exonuclease V) alpha subunit
MNTITTPKLNAVAPPPLNAEQDAALTAAIAWINDTSPDRQPFFILKGYAGTGKTFTVKSLVDRVKGRFVFCAPTNKATKVLRDSFSGTGYKPDCRTIYSLLGLRLEANGEVKELKVAERAPDEEQLDLSLFKAVIIDEASMLPLMLLRDHITEASNTTGARFLFMGDPAQLPPVGEIRSPVWGLSNLGIPTQELTHVMRHDNQILKLVTTIREKVDLPLPNIKLASDNDSFEGVWHSSKSEWLTKIRETAVTGAFHDGSAKAIAWRNVTVDQLNALIRSSYFPGARHSWVDGDRVIFTSPAKDLDEQLMATTDDEGRATRVVESYHPYYGDLKTYDVDIELDTGKLVTARVLHPASAKAYETQLQDKAAAAKVNGRLWKEFWELKEAFHALRHAYALTAHRSQGSTYETCFVDASDILLNRNRQEAFRCLYVACSRPKKQLRLA